MADPISSSTSSSARDVCSFDDDPELTCRGPEAPANAPPAISYESPEPTPEPAMSSATSDLVRKFSTSTIGPMLTSPPMPARTTSAPPALVVRPGQVDFQTGIPRFEAHASLGGLKLNAGVDVLNVNAHVGVLNEDGSHGANLGWGANLLNGELTLDYRGWSLSIGAGHSLGGSIASGEGRDLDRDGVEERCFKMTLGPFTLGECDEL